MTREEAIKLATNANGGWWTEKSVTSLIDMQIALGIIKIDPPIDTNRIGAIGAIRSVLNCPFESANAIYDKLKAEGFVIFKPSGTQPYKGGMC